MPTPTLRLATPDPRVSVIAEANPVLQSIDPSLRFEIRKGRLWLTNDRHACAAVLKNRCGTVAFNYGRLGMGGTRANVAFQLIRWIRGETRLPLSAWRYWTGPKQRMGNGTTMALIEASSYGDPEKTKCILCGINDPSTLDWWWNADGTVGPCCTFGACTPGRV